MSLGQDIDYAALAAKHGGAAQKSVDYRALASKHGGTAVSTPTATVSAAPPLTSAAGAKRAGYTWLEKGLEALPLVGGIAGAIAGEGWASVPLAGLGGAGGEAGRQLIRRAVGWNAPQTSTQAATDIAKEGASQAAAEATGQIGARALKPIGQALKTTAIRGTRVPLLPSEAGVGGPTMKRLEAMASHFYPSAPIMQRFKEGQAARAVEVLGQEIGRISGFRGTAEEAGELTQKAIETSRDELKREVNSAYAAIDDLTKSETVRVPKTTSRQAGFMTYTKKVFRPEQVGGVQPETAGVKQVAIKLLREIQQQEKFMDPKLLADSKSMLEQIVRSPKHVPYQTMAKSRSDLLALGRKLDEALPGKRAGIAKLLAGEIDESMISAAEKSGIPGLPEQVRAANAMNKEMHRKFEQKLITTILDSKNPEMVAGYVRKAGLSDLRDMNALLKEPERRMLQSQVVREVMRDQTGALRTPADFAKHFEDIGEERAKEIFGRNYEPLRNLARTLSKVGEEKGVGQAATLHNWSYMMSFPTAAGALVMGHPIGAAATLGTVGVETVFMRKLARVLTNPAKAARAVDLMQRGLRGAPYAVYGLSKLVTMEDDPEQEYPVPGIPRPPNPITGGQAIPPPPQ